MVHKLYDSDVKDGEVCKGDIQPLLGFRVKTPGGKYVHILADSRASAKKWLDEETAQYKASV